jgi:hypothetical protein
VHVDGAGEGSPPSLGSSPGLRPHLRSISKCVDDALWPGKSLPPKSGFENLRILAIEEVLATLPLEAYQLLKEEAARFEWFIPSDQVLGQIHPFRAAVDWPNPGAVRRPWARVVYLSPLLEQQDWSVVITVVVHELAHVILGHQVLDLDLADYERQEDEARQVVRQWGFEAEAERADELLRTLALDRLVPESQRGIRPAKPTATN